MWMTSGKEAATFPALRHQMGNTLRTASLSASHHETQVALHLGVLHELALLVHESLVLHPLVVLIPVACGWMEVSMRVVSATVPVEFVLVLNLSLLYVICACSVNCIVFGSLQDSVMYDVSVYRHPVLGHVEDGVEIIGLAICIFVLNPIHRGRPDIVIETVLAPMPSKIALTHSSLQSIPCSCSFFDSGLLFSLFFFDNLHLTILYDLPTTFQVPHSLLLLLSANTFLVFLSTNK
mmetsp:Transcript_20327/g.27971  ORF Transcript_20327/g.27971 Transcript_20327/m.27971 type:complete len:236 (+) Transcript_20327:170-877(+)